MASFSYKQITTSRQLFYSYIHIAPTQAGREYILFLHGFPSSTHDWRHQIIHFQQRGYGIIAPDLLGYGRTSKPLDMQLYSGKGMAEDINEILIHEKISKKVIGVAHDWGSFLLSRLANFFPDMFSKLVFIDVGYVAPNHGLTEQVVNFVNSKVQEKMGYSVMGYFLFFKEDDAAQLLDAHCDSAQCLFHSRDDAIRKKYMGAVGGIRSWLEEGQTAETAEYFTNEDMEYNRKLFAPESGGYGPSLNWYRAQLYNINEGDDKTIPQENHILKQPTLFLAANNFISAAADFPSQMKPFAPKLEVQQVDAGHWMQLERPEEVNKIIESFVEG